ncbi:MAG: hypothetical protein H7321_07710 [Bacteroidia bacterium]|nr:hypothetical protein [Bacteroidia bacterium]
MKKYILLVSLVVVMSTFIIVLSDYEKSTGIRTGYLVNIKVDGNLFKTFEGELNAGITKPGESVISTENWHFSIEKDNKNLFDSLKEMEHHRVKLYFHEYMNSLPWKRATKYSIYKAETFE